MILTNSFGANRPRLARYGLDRQVSEINWRAGEGVARGAERKRGRLRRRLGGPALAAPGRRRIHRR
ncbi:MAG: hypothetical protein WDO13_15075 [Verrucomicrobiota bacterium]